MTDRDRAAAALVAGTPAPRTRRTLAADLSAELDTLCAQARSTSPSVHGPGRP